MRFDISSFLVTLTPVTDIAKVFAPRIWPLDFFHSCQKRTSSPPRFSVINPTAGQYDQTATLSPQRQANFKLANEAHLELVVKGLHQTLQVPQVAGINQSQSDEQIGSQSR